MRGIDVSIHNAPVDWQAVKAAGMDFAICRTGYGKTGVDESFAANVEGAHKAGLICGAYHYSYALNPTPVPSYQVPNPYTGCCAPSYCGCNG